MVTSLGQVLPVAAARYGRKTALIAEKRHEYAEIHPDCKRYVCDLMTGTETYAKVKHPQNYQACRRCPQRECW